MLIESVRRWLVDAATMFVVAAASLFLLLYVGFGDGKRTYEQMQVEKLTSQGRYLRNSIEKFVRDGLPLKQYPGFATIAAPLLEGDDIDALIVYDHAGHQIFFAIDKNKPKLPEAAAIALQVNEAIKVHYGDTHYQIVLPLKSRFETVGNVVVVAPNSRVAARLKTSFMPLVYVAAALSVLFSIVVVASKERFARSKKPWLQITYGMTFLVMAIAVVGTLVGLYFDGVEGKARASAFTLSQRLGDITEFRLGFKDFEGIDRAFREYKNLNSEVSEAAILIGNTVEISTESRRANVQWKADPTNFEYGVDVAPIGKTSDTKLVVTVPKSTVFERVARSVKNFAALFIASAFLSGLFLQVAASLQLRGPSTEATEGNSAANDAGLVIIKPAYFLVVFLDSLTYSFLPKFMQEAAMASGLSVGFASAPFTAYYLGFALSLIPAGVLCDRRGPKPMILLGLALAATSVLALALPVGIWGMTGLRALSGIGQGILLIGVQSYILAVASPEKKTQGAAIIVFGFQAGLISGMALGSLMVNFLGTSGVFVIAGGVGLANIIYCLALVPSTERKPATSSLPAAVKKLTDDLKKVITNLEFLKTLFCIGMPAKAILTGVITFAIPLVLGQAGYRPEDIGQVVMLYGLGVVISSGYASRMVDRTKNSEMVLFIGALMSGAGLALVGLMDSPILGNGTVSTIAVVIAVSLVGVAHGFINAPVVTHVGQTALAKRIGANPTTTAYRFLERGGHVAGPLLLSQFFLLWGQGPHIIGGIGITVLILGLFFVAYRLLPQPKLRAEPAE